MGIAQQPALLNYSLSVSKNFAPTRQIKRFRCYFGVTLTCFASRFDPENCRTVGRHICTVQRQNTYSDRVLGPVRLDSISYTYHIVLSIWCELKLSLTNYLTWQTVQILPAIAAVTANILGNNRIPQRGAFRVLRRVQRPLR